MNRLRIALTGASGFIGSHLAESIVARGHELTCLLRKTSSTQYLQNVRFRTIYGDIGNIDSLTELVDGQDVLIHAAAVTKAKNESEYMRANAEGTETLLKATVSAGKKPSRLVLLSTQAVAGPTPGDRPLNESDPVNPLTAYGRSKARAEEICKSYSDRVSITIIRPPTVFGPRDKDVLAFFKLVKLGIQPIIGVDNQVSVVSVMNLIHGVMLSIENPKSSFDLYYITDDGYVTWTKFGRLIANILDKKLLRIRIPLWTMHLVSVLSEAYGKVTRKPVLLNREKMLEIIQPQWLVSNQKARLDLGFEPVTTTEQGIAKTLKWYKEAGWL